jgi:hypothetical protein
VLGRELAGSIVGSVGFLAIRPHRELKVKVGKNLIILYALRRLLRMLVVLLNERIESLKWYVLPGLARGSQLLRVLAG